MFHDKFGFMVNTVVDESSGSEPELSAVLAGGVHDAEVVLPVA